MGAQFPATFWKLSNFAFNYLFGGGTTPSSDGRINTAYKYDFVSDTHTQVANTSKTGYAGGTIQDKNSSTFMCGSTTTGSGTVLSDAEKRVFATDTSSAVTGWPAAIFSFCYASSETIGYSFAGRISSTAVYGRNFSTGSDTNYATMQGQAYLRGTMQSKTTSYLVGFQTTAEQNHQKFSFATNTLANYTSTNLGWTGATANNNGVFACSTLTSGFRFGHSSGFNAKTIYASETQQNIGLVLYHQYGTAFQDAVNGVLIILGGLNSSFTPDSGVQKYIESTGTVSAQSQTYSERRNSVTSNVIKF